MEGKGFRIPQLSILRGTQPTRNIIRENKLHQLESVMQLGRKENMFTMETYNEWLWDKRDTLKPLDSLKPSSEEYREILHTPSLLNEDHVSPPEPASPSSYVGQEITFETYTDVESGQPAANPGARDPRPASEVGRSSLLGFGNEITITDELPVDQVIAELNGSAPSAGKIRTQASAGNKPKVRQ